MKYNKEYLHNAYNATSTGDENGEIETYENWLEKQLISRMERIDELESIGAKTVGVVGHVNYINTQLDKAVTAIHSMGKEVVIIATDEINPKPPSELMIESEPFIIEKLPEIKEPFYPKAKHVPKGHQRPYKFHR